VSRALDEKCPNLTGLTLVTSENQKDFSRFNEDIEWLMKKVKADLSARHEGQCINEETKAVLALPTGKATMRS
jgi:hypothetical protein